MEYLIRNEDYEFLIGINNSSQKCLFSEDFRTAITFTDIKKAESFRNTIVDVFDMYDKLSVVEIEFKEIRSDK